MNIPKQFINLLGAVVVIAILIGGVVLVALPLYSGAQTTDASTRTVQQTNDVYAVQVAQLQAANDDIDGLNTRLGVLREQIPVITQLDDVYEIVDAAAEETDATIQTVAAADPEAWTVRAVTPDETGAAVDAPAPAPTESAESTPVDDAEEVAADAAPVETAPATPDPASPQKQIGITITVTVTDAEQSTAFIDALGQGPRLISPVSAALSSDSLTVNALVYLQTED